MRLSLTMTAIVLIAVAAPHARAGIIADSIADYSLVQGQGGWSYGFYDETEGAPYDPAGFTQFDVANAAENSWKASDTLVPSPPGPGDENNTFLNINAVGGHPTGVDIDGQDRILWAIRRFQSSLAGPVSIAYDVHKLNTTNLNGGGITGRIFVDGVEKLSQFIANDDGTGVQGVLTVPVSVGSLIDFVIDPLGVQTQRDGPNSPRADGSHFSAVISDAVAVPEPGGLWFAGLLVTGLFLRQFSPRSTVRKAV